MERVEHKTYTRRLPHQNNSSTEISHTVELSRITAIFCDYGMIGTEISFSLCLEASIRRQEELHTFCQTAAGRSETCHIFTIYSWRVLYP